MNSRGETEGVKFLKEINSYADNHSSKNAVTAPRAGDGLADLLFAELTRTRRPQVLGYDQPKPGKAGEWEHKHALVVYDAERLATGKTVFFVGDPNYPDKDNLRLVYDPATGDWLDFNFPAVVRGPDRKMHSLIQGFRPCFIHWDETNRRIADIPQKQRLLDLMAEVQKAAKNKPITAHAIGDRLGLLTGLPGDQFGLNF